MMTSKVFRGTTQYSRRILRQINRLCGKGALVVYLVLAIAALYPLNWMYQVARKPGELLAPISASFSKSPDSTWRVYGALFEKHSTEIVSAEFLAALAQVESDGNPIATTYWRWRWSWNPFDVYRPASSALGMFQFTDGTFAEARKYCIHEHEVVEDGAWYDMDSCWFNVFYTRTIASHAIELTSAYLHQRVVDTLNGRSTAKISLARKQRLAAVIHLCGAAKGRAFADAGFQPAEGDTCGAHNLRRYLARVDRMRKLFGRLSEINGGTSRFQF